MNAGIALVLLAGGILLTISGVIEMDSFNSDISRFFTGAATGRAIWMTAGGLGIGLVGVMLLMQSK